MPPLDDAVPAPPDDATPASPDLVTPDGGAPDRTAPVAEPGNPTLLDAPAPGVPLPGAPAPGAPLPGAPAPGATTPPDPDAAAPGVSAPGVSAPGVSAPSVSAPSVSAPSVSAPDVSAPGGTPPAAPTADGPTAGDPVTRTGTRRRPATDRPATDRPAPRPRRGTGVREERRLQTRETIVDAAAALFGERGFDAVSVTEIARRAGVVEKTVFNHFPVKEGLVFEADPPIRAALVDAVRRRPDGQSAVVAAGAFVVAAVGRLGSPRAREAVAAMATVVRGSRTLVAREREILAALTDALAAEMAAETGAEPGDLQPWLAAHAVLGLYAGLLDLARDRALAGTPAEEMADQLRAAGDRGLALLSDGLAGYAVR